MRKTNKKNLFWSIDNIHWLNMIEQCGTHGLVKHISEENYVSFYLAYILKIQYSWPSEMKIVIISFD